ncbi:ABC transporter permease [Sphingobacterium kyonggiense]|uniref:ABC transporter permease n=1 Tax=Sphingobacterium kyonggiense TaxID=714075 RepID=A0ABP7YVD3_9SPHI
MLKNWFKVFLYNSLQNKLFFLLTVFGLAIGMTGVILAMLYWEDEHAYNNWVPDKEKIAEVSIDFNENKWAWMIAPVGTWLKEKSPELDSYLYYAPKQLNEPFQIAGKSIYIKDILNTQSNFFDFFPFEIIKGNVLKFKGEVNSVALEENTAFQLFADEDPIGKTITSSSGAMLVVTTVYKGNPSTSFRPNMVFHLLDEQIKNGVANNNTGDFLYGLLIKAKDETQLPIIQNQLNSIMDEFLTSPRAKDTGLSKEDYISKHGAIAVHLMPLNQVRLNNTDLPSGLPAGKGNYTFLYINVGLSILILIISIFNYINLSTAYAMKRAKEIGVRKVVGSTTKNIVFQLIFETAITTLISIVLTLALVEVLLPFYNSLLDKDLHVQLLNYVPFFLGLLLLVILLAGILPAMYIANFEILKVIKGNFSRSQSGIWIRNTMIVLQFCIATFFIISGIVVSVQVNYAMKKDLGFQADQNISIDWTKRSEHKLQDYELMKQELKKIPGVSDVTAATFVIGRGASSSTSFNYNDKTVQSQNMGIDFNTLDMYNIKVVGGRNIQVNLSSDTTDAVLLNKTAVEMIGEKEILNKTIKWNGRDLKVIGIVDDFHLAGLDNKIPPMTFFHLKTVSWMQTNLNSLIIKLKPEDMDKTISQIETYWKSNVDAERPFSFEFVDQQFAKTYAQYVKQRNVFSILTVVVISIALLGLFALASYTIERRYKEIAIKKVLGAETKELVLNLIKQYIILLTVGFILAIVPSYYLMQKWLENFAYRIDLPIYAFFMALVMMFVLTMLIVLGKAISATRINSLTYIKYE